MTAISALPPIKNFEFPELQRAVQHRDPAATSALIKKLFGLDIKFDYKSHLMEGLFKDYTHLQQSLEKLCATRPSYSSAAHKAAFRGSIDTLRQTLQLDVKDSKGLTPLHYALLGGSKEAVRYLIDKTALAELTSAKESYLHFAALTGDPEILALFLQKGCSASSKNAMGLTAAHYWAARSDKIDGLKMLAEAGAVLHSPNQRLLTPVSILILKALGDPNGPLCWKDLLLLFVNLARMSQLMAMHQYGAVGAECKLSHIFGYRIEELARAALGIFKRTIAAGMTTDDSTLQTLAVSPIGALTAAIADKAAGTNLFSLTSSAATTATVVQHARRSLERCKNASLPMQLLATPIHLFNSASAIGDTAFRAAPFLFVDPAFLNCRLIQDITDFPATMNNAEDELLKFFDGEQGEANCAWTKKYLKETCISWQESLKTGDWGCERFTAQPMDCKYVTRSLLSMLREAWNVVTFTSPCTKVDPEKYKQMSVLERLNQQELTARISETTSEKTRENCFHNLAVFLNPNMSPLPKNCDEAKPSYREAARELHPDGKKKIAGLEEAFIKLGNIYESFCPRPKMRPRNN